MKRELDKKKRMPAQLDLMAVNRRRVEELQARRNEAKEAAEKVKTALAQQKLREKGAPEKTRQQLAALRGSRGPDTNRREAGAQRSDRGGALELPTLP